MTTGKFHAMVAGVTMKNPNGKSRQDYIHTYCKPGMPIMLRREPNNPYDSNAVGVWILARALWVFTDDVQIGYLPAGHVAEEIARHMDRGGTVTGEIVNITGGTHDKPTLGVNILLNKS